VRGRVQGSGDLRIEGRIEGDVTVSGDLAIEAGGAVTGDVDAASVVISGALQGDVAARGPVSIRAGAQVTGNMGGAEVSLDEGAGFSGRIEADFELPAELTTGGGRANAPARRR
jgi:cytoskeletal protein CcmA (bactofilin family)